MAAESSLSQSHSRFLQLRPVCPNTQTQLLHEQRKRRSSAGMVHKELSMSAVYIFSVIILCLQMRTENVQADPVLASSLGSCQDVAVAEGALHCCLPAPTRKPIRFRLPKGPADMPPIIRERKPAHVLQNDTEYVMKYNLAYARMKALPDSDPRSFRNQWKIHCSCSNGAFQQRKPPGPLGTETGDPEALQVHYHWTFAPWHRMYLYYHERILGDLIDDPTFALPFWNWDNQLDPLASMMPFMYLPKFPVNNSALVDVKRNTKHMPPQYLHLGGEEGENMTDAEIRYENLCVLYNAVATKVSSRDFLGGPYVARKNITTTDDGSFFEPGGLETVHNHAHAWTGLANDPEAQDMGNFIFAAKDPIFYAHHSNIDRLWDVWKSLPDKVTKGGSRKRRDFPSKDFLDSEFTFYDENGDMVIIKIRDTLDSAKLGYKYANVSEADNLWINYEPLPSQSSSKTRNFRASDWPTVDPTANNSIGVVPVSYKLVRSAPSKKDVERTGLQHVKELQENILLENVKIRHSSYARLDVFINNPEATRVTHLYMAEYVGTFTHLASGMVDVSSSPVPDSSSNDSANYGVFNIRFSIDASLRRLGILDYDTDITVTSISRGRAGESLAEIYFSDIKQDFQ